MEIPEGHFRHILLFYFRKGKNATQAYRKLCGVYSDQCLSERQCQNWFARFRSGNFNVQDEPAGRPIVEKVEEILEKIAVDRYISSRDIATKLNIDHKTVLSHLHKTGDQKKLDTWVAHGLTMKNLMDRVSICESLLKRNEIEPFLKRMITGDEKWITKLHKRLQIDAKEGDAECLVGWERNCLS